MQISMPNGPPLSMSLEALESELLVTAIHRHYGYDLSHYSRESFTRRCREFSVQSGFSSIANMISHILNDTRFFHRFLQRIMIGVTEFFRDIDFFHVFKEAVMPQLLSFPYIKIWHAGCSTGEEVYSMAMMLDAHGQLKRSVLYATDINDVALASAQRAIYPASALINRPHIDSILLYPHHSQDYYHMLHDRLKIHASLGSTITWAHHNLVSDNVFG